MPKPLNILPRGVRIHPLLRLRTWQPSGLLDAKRANEILHFVEMEEKFVEEPFNRFVDLTAIDAIRLSIADIEKLATRRFESYRGASVKSAIFALNPLAFGIARMYEQLMRRTPIEVRVFCRLTSVATWLNIPIEALASRDDRAN